MKTLFCAVLVAAAIPFAAFAQQQGEQPEPHRHRVPPPEAIAACQGKEAGAECSFTHKERTIQGTCFAHASDKPLACRPSKAPAAPPAAQ